MPTAICAAMRGRAAGATWQGASLPLIGRVSMDLIAFDASDAGAIGEGDWLALDYDLPSTATRSGLSQYELLTGLGAASSEFGPSSEGDSKPRDRNFRLPDPPRRDPFAATLHGLAGVAASRRDRGDPSAFFVEDDGVALPIRQFLGRARSWFRRLDSRD
jgi:hypothetical protein